MVYPVERDIGQNDGYLPRMKQIVIAYSGEIFKTHQFDYGWEKWMQAEFAKNLLESVLHEDIKPEQRIWGDADTPDARRVDLWARSKDEVPHIGVELKCRTAMETEENFRKRFCNDIIKVSGRPVQGNTPCILYAVALSTNFDPLENYEGVTVPIHYEQVAQELYMLYAEVYHN